MTAVMQSFVRVACSSRVSSVRLATWHTRRGAFIKRKKREKKGTATSQTLPATFVLQCAPKIWRRHRYSKNSRKHQIKQSTDKGRNSTSSSSKRLKTRERLIVPTLASLRIKRHKMGQQLLIVTRTRGTSRGPRGQRFPQTAGTCLGKRRPTSSPPLSRKD